MDASQSLSPTAGRSALCHHLPAHQSQSFEYQALAVARTGGDDAIIALEDSQYQLCLPVIRQVTKLQFIPQTMLDLAYGEILTKRESNSE